MKTTILDLVQRRDHVSFSELAAMVPGFSGEFSLSIPDYPTIVLWPWLSEAGATALTELLRDHQIHMHVADVMAYMADRGSIPALPLATGAKRYRSPRWLPVTFSTRPAAPAKTRR